MSVRRTVREKAQNVREKGMKYTYWSISLGYWAEIWSLVYWEEEDTVTYHPERELVDKEQSTAVGVYCSVKFGKRLCRGEIAAIGKVVGGTKSYCQCSMHFSQIFKNSWVLTAR